MPTTALAIALAALLVLAPALARAQEPGAAPLPPKEDEAPVVVTEFDTVQVGGRLAVVGIASPGARIEIRDGEAVLGTGEANAAGEWLVFIVTPLAEGSHDLSVATLIGGAVVAPPIRVEVSVQAPVPPVAASPAVAVIAPPPTATVTAATGAGVTVTIHRGQTLWELAQSAYGDGKRYGLIVEANRELIRNPNLIYPGQVLLIPALSGN